MLPMSQESTLIQKIDFAKDYGGLTFNSLPPAFQIAIVIDKLHEVIDEVNKLSMKTAVKKKTANKKKYKKRELDTTEKLRKAFL